MNEKHKKQLDSLRADMQHSLEANRYTFPALLAAYHVMIERIERIERGSK
jgi:hypothetical protein